MVPLDAITKILGILGNKTIQTTEKKVALDIQLVVLHAELSHVVKDITDFIEQ